MTMEFTIRTELREVASSETIRVDEQAKGVHDAADYRSGRHAVADPGSPAVDLGRDVRQTSSRVLGIRSRFMLRVCKLRVLITKAVRYIITRVHISVKRAKGGPRAVSRIVT